jgi:GMP synthase-like glutamine amidotransferase
MHMLRIHYFQHVPFEGLGCIETWAFEKEHTLTATKFYTAYQLPEIEMIDWLIVMGGPMSVHDEAIQPWLKDEKAFIKKAIAAGKTVVGICLGAQLVAEALGASIYLNAYKEIGWFDVRRTPQANNTLLNGLEPAFTVFDWHGDTFDLPEGAEHLLQSEACINQAFLFQQKVLGLQFHFEVTAETLNGMIQHGQHELVQNKYVQTEEQILAQTRLIEENNQRLYGILNRLQQSTI